MEEGALGLLALVALWAALAAWRWCGTGGRRGTGRPSTTCRRGLWRPRTPEDCPACRAAGDATTLTPSPTVRPWADVKSRRGAPKRVATEGFACPSPGCAYYGIADSRVQALVG